jgi:Leucine-rich repeat (LRR) protein
MADIQVNVLSMTECPDSYSSNVSELVTSLQSNSAIEKVHFAGEFLRGLSQQDQLALLGEVGHLKALKQIYLGNASIQVSLLSKVVRAAKDLSIFSLGCVKLEGNRDDFIDLEFSIRRHKALTQLVWEDFVIVDSDAIVDRNANINGIIKALSMLRTLEVVKLVASQESNMSLAGLSLTSLCESLSLHEMHFSRFKLDRMAFSMISWAIKTTQLNSLALTDCAIDDEACAKIAAAVGLNNCLERLDLSNNNIGDDGCKSLADGLTANTDLKYLCLSNNKSIGAYGCGALARMLEENHYLERLEAPIGDDHDCRIQIDECLNNNRKNNSNRATAA